jgi:hypothetical protein
VALFCIANAALLFAKVAPQTFLLDEIDYGDSYVLYDVQRFQDTGVIYRDLSLPPYTLTSYSPLVYMFFSLPGRTAASDNPFIKPRSMVIAAFLLCIVIVVSIARALIPSRSGGLWCLLLATTIATMQHWVLQLRGEFPGIAFSLLAIRLLLMRSAWGISLAGVAAGLASQFKFTFVAALAAGALWLLLQRRGKDLAVFVGAGFLASAGLYFLFWLREPRMIQHLTSLRIGFIDAPGCFEFIYVVFTEPVVLLSTLAMPMVFANCSSGRALLASFVLISFVIAGLTDLHPGGNINYFFEGLFAVVPIATIGVIRLLSFARRSAAVSLFLIALFFGPLMRGRFHELFELIVHPATWVHAVASNNASFRQVQDALKGRHIFSTDERLALLDPAPALINSFAFWTIKPRPIYDRLRGSEFDVVITAAIAKRYRHIEHVSADLRRAISASYAPHCVIRGALLQLPRNRPANAAFLQKLDQIGCAAVAPRGSVAVQW